MVVTITGHGLSMETGVTVCGDGCTVNTVSGDQKQLECTMDPVTVGGKTDCDVNVTVIDQSG